MPRRGVDVQLYFFFNFGARWSTPRSGCFTPGNDPARIVQESGWASGPDFKGGENLALTGIRYPERPARRQSLYRLGYRGPHKLNVPSYNKYWPEDGLKKPKHVAKTKYY